MALTKITKQGVGADAIDATKIADDAISEEHLDVSAITGNAELSATADSNDVLLVFDTSASAIKKIQVSNVNSAPTISSISPTNANTGDGTGNHTFTITGTNFDSSATAFFLNNSGTEVAFDSVTRNSATQLTGVIAKSSLLNSGEPFDIVALNSNGQQAKLRNQVNVNAQPTFNANEIRINLKNQIDSPVLWTNTIVNMKNDNALKMIEVGPGKVLQGLTRKIDKDLESFGVENLDQINEIDNV